ncbi:MAG TPA: cardiolipin synthase [Nocardioides sp.]|nr:cardiolipin synthase [Nocardioides sp.]
MFTEDWTVLAALAGIVVVATGLTIRIAALGIIPGGRKPATGMAWLLAVLLSPLLGLIAFAMFGRTRLEKKRYARQQEAHNRILEAARNAPSLAEDSGQPPYVVSVTRLNHRLGALPLQSDNDVELFEDYQESIAAMTAAISNAEHFVNVEFYITAWDEMTEPMFAAMVDATQRGVTVRLLFDHLGSRGIPGYKDMLTKLEATEIQWHRMLPVELRRGRVRRPDLRNHRKLVVVDGRLGFTGSQNLIEPGYNKPKNHAAGRKWVELMVRLRGPVVAALDAVFASDWFTETGDALPVSVHPAPDIAGAGVLRTVPCQLVPSGPGYHAENNLRMFTTLIYGAHRRLSITSPYFVPDESLLYAVTTAAQRGVEVELFVSEQSDQFMVGHAQASYYRALLEAGVTIQLYPEPYVLHSKHFTVDDQVAVICSSNMDLRSFALNYEISLMLLGPPVVARVRAVEDNYRALSRTLTLEEWDQRPGRKKYLDNVMRLTAALQ